MQTYLDENQENKNQSVSDVDFHKWGGRKSLFQFVGDAQEAIAHRKIQKLADNSPQVKQAAQLQAIADNYSAKHQQPIQRKENSTGLPDNLKSGIENLSGYSMDDVKVHRNSDKPAKLQAHAYAQGTAIHLGPGQERHLPHEAWHVVQQKQGRVKPTLQMKGKININDDAGLEREADVLGARAFQIGNSRKTVSRPLKKTNTYFQQDVAQGLLLPEAKREIEEDQMTLKKEWKEAVEENRNEDKGLIARLQSATGRKPEAIMMVDGDLGDQVVPRDRLHTVSLSSQIHHLNKLAEKYLDVMTQPWGFSFADKKLQKADLDEINAYIDHYNNGLVDKRHRVEIDKVQYTARSGRVYSTHSDSSQLYPIGGPGVYCGNGAGDMYHILNKLGLATDSRVIRLHQAYIHSQSSEFIQASEEKRAGGHRSGVTIPKGDYTPAANIKKMKPSKLKPLLDEAIKFLSEIKTTTQFSLGE